MALLVGYLAFDQQLLRENTRIVIISTPRELPYHKNIPISRLYFLRAP